MEVTAIILAKKIETLSAVVPESRVSFKAIDFKSRPSIWISLREGGGLWFLHDAYLSYDNKTTFNKVIFVRIKMKH